MMSVLKWLVIVVAVSYCALLLLVYSLQRSLMYFPATERVAPTLAGLPAASELELASDDGERIVAWHVAPQGDRPVIVYFHGNGGNLGHRVTRFRDIVGAGYGLVALDYRGYGGSSGHPTEAGIMMDAAAAYAEAARRYSGRLVLWGESLGTAVAVALAADRDAKAVILEAPFVSALDLAARRYPFFPVSWLMKDPFRSDLEIARVRAPVLVMHGAADNIVPIGEGERLFGMITAPKQFVRFANGGHVDLSEHGAFAAARAFIDGLP